MKKSELEAIIRQIIREEVQPAIKKYIQSYTPIVVNEVVNELVDKRLNEIIKPKKKSTTSIKELLSEGTELEEWPTLGGKVQTTSAAPAIDRSRIASLLGYGDSPIAATNVIKTIVTDAGTEIPVPPDALPAEVVKAMNTDYRSFLKKMDQNKGKAASFPMVEG